MTLDSAHLLDVLPEPAILLSGDGRICSANAPLAQLLARPARELRGTRLAEHVADPDGALAGFLERCARSRQLALGSLHLQTADGEPQVFRCEGALVQPAPRRDDVVLFLRLRPRDEASNRFLLLNRKIEELSREVHRRMQAEEELYRIQADLEARVASRTAAMAQATEGLRRSNEALQHFASIASHDLQEPLRKIASFGDLLLESNGHRLDESGRDMLGRMRAAAQRMQLLIRSLLDYSKVSAHPYELVPVSMAAVVRSVLEDLDVRIVETGAQVEIGDLPVIEADAGQMYQLVQNLVTNALKFHRSGVVPRIRINSRPVDGSGDGLSGVRFHQIAIEDNGIGFDAAIAPRLFDLFQRLHGRSQYEGAGIGLAICKRIAERHGGSIRAEGRPGEGAVFIVTLPEHQIEKALHPVE